MKNIARQVSLVAISLVAVLGLAVVPVSAETGAGSGSSSNTVCPVDEAEDCNTTTTSNTGGDQGKTPDGGSVHDSNAQSSAKLRGAAAQLLRTDRQNIKQHTEAQRQKACVQRQKSIDTRTTNYVAAAQRHLNVFNSIFTKVQAFQTSKQLNVPNYDSLVAAATSQQTAAQSAVDSLKALDVKIDCAQPDPATTVATIKTAVINARAMLQSYRSDIKDLIVALKGASTAQGDTSSTTGGDQ